jgi:hypothetical protein
VICPAPPDDDFNVALVVFIVVAALFFGLTRREDRDKAPERPVAEERE